MKKYFFFFALLCAFQTVHAQSWTQVQDTLLQGVSPHYWAKGSFGYLISDVSRIYKMTSYSQPWQNAMTGIPSNQRNFAGLVISHDTAYALSTFDKLYQSIDGGANWSELAISGIPVNFLDPDNYFVEMSAIPGRLFLTFTFDSCYSSTDGINWTFFNRQNQIGGIFNGELGIWTNLAHNSMILYNAALQPLDTTYYFTPMPGNVQATSNDGKYEYSYNAGDSTIYRVDLEDPNQVLVAYAQHVYDSTIGPGDTYQIWGKYHMIRKNYYSPTGKGMLEILFSSDSGQTWASRPDLRWVGDFVSLATNGDSVLATDYNNLALKLSVNAAASWTKLQPEVNGLDYDNVLATPGLDTLYWRYSFQYGSSVYKGIERSIDGGQTWEFINSNLPPYQYGYLRDSTITSYDFFDMILLGPAVFVEVNEYDVYRTINGGQSWQQVTLPPPPTSGGDVPVFVGKEDNSLFMGLFAWQVDTFAYYRSNDLGNSWTQIMLPAGDTIGYNMPARYQITGKNDTLLLRYNQRIYYSSYDHFHLWFSTDNGLNWGEITPPMIAGNTSKRLGANDNTIPARTGMAFGSRTNKFMQIVETVDTVPYVNYINPPAFHDSLYLYDAGTWTVLQHSGLPADIDMQALSFDNGTWYLSSDYGVYSSTDDGLNWSANARYSSGNHDLSSGLDEGMKMYKLLAGNGSLVTATQGNGVWIYNGIPMGNSTASSQVSSGLNVFPVPANTGFIQWQTNTEQQKPLIKITDFQGRIVLHENAAPGFGGSIDISKLADGAYLLEVSDGKQFQRSRFVIAH